MAAANWPSATAAPSSLPHAIKHQERIEAAVLALVSLKVDVIEAIEIGGSRVFEKLLRCYHNWVDEEGICPYDDPLRGYFRMTPAARHAPPGTKVHCEHVVPIKELRKRLRLLWQSGAVTKSDVRCVLDANEIVVLTEDEVPLVNKHGVRKMPDPWKFGQSHLLRLELGLNLKDVDLVGKRLIGPPAKPSGTLPQEGGSAIA